MNRAAPPVGRNALRVGEMKVCGLFGALMSLGM
jgi:hypothetical protein